MAHGLGIIGNCSYNALLRDGSVEWLCWPRPDSSFVVGPLLDRERGGVFAVEGVGHRGRAAGVRREHERPSHRLPRAGGEFELLDFAPRFHLYDRFFKPSMLVRILRPLAGEPRARVRCRPTYEYGLQEVGLLEGFEPHRVHGLSYPGPADDERSAHVRRGRAAVPARERPPPRPHLGRAARGGARGDGRALPRADARLLAAVGEGHARARATTRARSSARRSRSSSTSTRTRARCSPPRRRACPSTPARGARGTTASAGSATRTSR